MYNPDLALSNLYWLICHKTKSNQTKPIFFRFDLLNPNQFFDGTNAATP